jgi:hypothetical protein
MNRRWDDAARKKHSEEVKRWRHERMKDDPFRLRDQRYLAFVRGKPCLVCGMPGDSHHIQYAQPRGLGRKTGDQYAVPVCREHHMNIHVGGIPERTWWALRGIDPMVWAEQSYAAFLKEEDWRNGIRD